MPAVRRLLAGSVACLVALATSTVSAQSTAVLTENTGATISVTTTVIGVAQGFPFNETDDATAAVAGDMTLSLFPADPSFDGVTLQAMQVSADPLAFSYCLLEIGSCLAGANVTVTDLVVELLSASSSSLDGGGGAVFTNAELHITGVATVIGTGGLAGQLNETLPIDITTNATQTAQITESAGTVTFSGFVFPQVSQIVPPEDLPAGVTALRVDLSTDASALTFSGPRAAALLGDVNADGVIDSADYAKFVDCLAGPGVSVPLPCPLVDFDFDADVDLWDFAEFTAVQP